MSVINRVLNDIEQRNEREKAAQGYEPVQIKEPASTGKWVIALIVCVICLGIAGYWLLQQSVNDGQSITSESIIEQEQEQEQVAGTEHQQTVAPQVVSESKAQVTEGIIDDEPQHRKHGISKVAGVRESIDERTVEEETVAEAIDVELATEAAVSETEKTSELMPEKLDAEAPVNAVNQVKNKRIQEPVRQEKLSITPVKMSPAELAQLKLTQGLKSQKVGNIETAQRHWRDALTLTPNLHDARVQLAASYYGENNIPKAIKLLSDGNKKYTEFDGYRLLAAQIYYQSNKLDKALSILNNPYLDENASDENLTLAASIAQQLKRWPAAMENYQQLVSRQQNNPQWLLGLAIAQDAQQMASKALKNYQKLLIVTNDQGVYNYAQQRINTLQSELVQRGHNG
ncbi:MAG: hypothetical protein BM565_13995 [Gammaproteobacteria bacterium MedPE]|nr:MAG: hypothetical protein BM565_13995 [Gammaproteobacteria bacterium MedPE]